MERKAASGIILTLLVVSMLTLAFNIQPIKATISNYEWIDPAYFGYDPFFGRVVVAYRAGSVAKISVELLNDWFVTDTILNISAVKIGFDWGVNYTSTAVSTQDPFELPWSETHTFNVSFVVPPTSIASDLVLHEFDIWVEHVDAQHNIIGSWVMHGNNFAVYPELRIWTVDDDGPADFHTIQEAINAASPGDTILVASGTYNENVKVYKSLSIMGEGPSSTVLNALDSSDHAFRVTSDFANISGFTVQGATGHYRAGIRLYAVSHCNISSNCINLNSMGIYLESSVDNEISNNHLNSHEFSGIVLWFNTNNNTIVGNDVENSSYYGIIVDQSNNNTVSKNKLSSNGIGIHLISSNNNKITDNDASDNSYCGIAVSNSDNNSLVANNASSNLVDGIILASSNNNVVEENIASHNNLDFWNSHGINIYGGSSKNTIRHNIISTNMIGIGLGDSSGNIVLENDLVTNLNHAIRTDRANGNSIYHNNFIDNLGQVYNWEQQSMNVWDDGYPSGGNYWSDYTDVDLYSGPNQDETGDDGIWDYSYIIDLNNKDGYPLVNPWIPRTVGVQVGDWVKYTMDIIGYRPGFPVDLNDVEWGKTSVQAISGTTIEVELLWHLKNGTEITTTGPVDVVTSGYPGPTSMSGLFISRDLPPGATLYATYPFGAIPPSLKINETIFKEYLGVSRETNHVNATKWEIHIDAYWDKTTGVLCEFEETFSTSWSWHLQIVDTNLWKAPIPTSIDELKTKVEELGSEDEIDNQGIIKSLLAKLNVAQKLVDKGKVDEAEMVLNGFIMQVQKLSGIHITVEAADILIQSAEHIISEL